MEKGIGGQLLWDAVKGVKGPDAHFITISGVMSAETDSVHQAHDQMFIVQCYALATVIINLSRPLLLDQRQVTSDLCFQNKIGRGRLAHRRLQRQTL